MPERVRVRCAAPPGHVRVPWYLRGKTGIIECRLGSFGNPEQLAYGLDAPHVELLRVRFRMEELWGNGCEKPDDTLDAEVHAHWIEPAGPCDDG